MLEAELAADRRTGEEMAGRLRECAARGGWDPGGAAKRPGEAVTAAEVSAQRLRDEAAEAELESAAVAERLGFGAAPEESAHAEDPQAARRGRRRE